MENPEDEELSNIIMNNEQFQSAVQGMNSGQRRIFNIITEKIDQQLNGEVQRERIFISGGAGTGKTFLLKLLKNQVNTCYGKSVVKVGAPTGVGAELADGYTLNSLLKLPLQRDRVIDNILPPLDDDYLRVMRERGNWEDVEFLLIDNVSVVSSEILGMIDSRLRELKCQDDSFGGINVLLFGDLMALQPIQGQKIFRHPLWQLFNMIELQQNMRQQEDRAFIDILDALRVGQLTPEHLDILLEKVLTDATNEFSIERVLRIYPTNALADQHNEKVIQHFQREGRTIYTIKAQDKPKFNSTIVENPYLLGNSNPDFDDISNIIPDVIISNIIPHDINATGGLPKVLKIFEGAKVMLRSNIDIENGPINGSMGIIEQIIWPFFEPDQVYDYDTNIPSVSVDFGREFGVYKIEPIARKFPVKENRYGIDECSRRMLPLTLIWAATVHKLQGITVDNAVVYLGSRIFATGQAYVALSCIKSLDGLQIEELDRSKLMGEDTCNTDALAEMRRLQRNE